MLCNRRKTLASLLFSGFTGLPGLSLHAQGTPASVADETWLDTARRREVPVKLRWPDAAMYPGQRSVVLFSHGLGGTREGGSVWGEAWAAAGFVVLHIQHEGSDLAAVRRVTANFTDKSALRSLATGAQLLARLRDVGFVLDEIGRRHTSNTGRWGLARPVQVGLAGHSFGATTTLGMAGQRYPKFDGVNEPRLAAFIALSPTAPTAPEASDAGRAFERITRPVLCVTGMRDGDMIGNGGTPERRAAAYAALPVGEPPLSKSHLVLQDADHMTFAGDTGRAAEIVPREGVTRDLQSAHHALVKAITTDWWRATLLDDEVARSRLRTPANLRTGDVWQQK